jgi:hypothetical protein
MPAPNPDATSERPANRLATETSPYLLQHAHNPVDWFPWGPDALARAKLLDRPIFLSIGYAACHWCHVMERESFEDEATAAYLNAHFVAIKVDREERPDLDQIYMSAVTAITGQGGWPMSVFLTPEGRPFFGGTYFPDQPRHGMPSFRQVLEGVERAWREQRPDVEQSGVRLVQALQGQQRLPAAPGAATRPMLDAAIANLEASFDAPNGGWGSAPKFPQPMTIEFLLRRAQAGDARALAMARRPLDAMAAGGIRDQLGGGFHRYSVDAVWLVPHFEEMLYDNGQLARAYLHAWQLTGEPGYREVATGVLDELIREFTTADGAFAASRDADTVGEEGLTYTWTAAEIRDVLEPEDAPLFEAAYGVTAGGNFEGRTILSRVREPESLEAELPADPRDLAAPEVERRLAEARARLLARRAERPQPGRDDKALAAWNGLAIAAFAEAARALAATGDADLGELAATYRAAGERAAAVILEGLGGTGGRARGLAGGRAGGRLGRSWKDGRASGAGVLEDHADLAEGLLALYQATGNERWFVAARDLAETILARFADPAGGFFDTADDHERLVARPKDVQDNAVPSGGAMAATVLLRLAALTGEGRYRDAADGAIAGVTQVATRYPTGFAQWLVAMDLALADGVEVAIVGDPADPATRVLIETVDRAFRPDLVLAVAPDPAASAVPLLADRTLVDGRPAAYVCRGFACRLPVTTGDALAAELAPSAFRA